MGPLRRLRAALGSERADGTGELHVGDPRFDDWEVVRELEEIDAARAWCQHLTEAGVEAVITSDWPLDRFGRGDIMLQVPAGSLERGRGAAQRPRLRPVADRLRPAARSCPGRVAGAGGTGREAEDFAGVN